MQRMRGDVTLTLWQWVLVCVLYILQEDTGIEEMETGNGTRYFVAYEGKMWWVFSRTCKSLFKHGLLRKRKSVFILSAAGRRAAESLMPEEMEAYLQMWPTQDLRYVGRGKNREVIHLSDRYDV